MVVSPDTLHKLDNPLYGSGTGHEPVEDPSTNVYSEPKEAYAAEKSGESESYAYTRIKGGEEPKSIAVVPQHKSAASGIPGIQLV